MKYRLEKLYYEILSDLLIGYPLDREKLDEIKLLMHKLHFVNFSLDSKTTLAVLERYA